MTSFIAMWIILAAIAAWGSFHFSMHDPRSTSWTKITFAGLLLVAFAAILVGLEWLSPKILPEGVVARVMLSLFYWSMAAIGAPLCVGSILGTLMGMYRSRDRYPS
jgi:hypothetical protein